MKNCMFFAVFPKNFRTGICLLCAFVLGAGLCSGQDRQAGGKDLFSGYRPRFILFGGTGTTAQPNVGVAFEGMMSLELGYNGPIDNFDGGRGFFSAGATVPPRMATLGKAQISLPVTLGYTRFGASNAINFGAGLDVVWDRADFGLRFEVRDYYKLSGRNEHNIAFRVGLLGLLDD